MKETFEKELTVCPGNCDASGRLSHHDVFQLFMDVASQHAEVLGVGLRAMAPRQLFWLTVRTKINFERMPALGEMVTVRTWPHAPAELRSIRSYQLLDKEGAAVSGKTEWAVMNLASGKLEPMSNVYPSDLNYPEESACEAPFERIESEFSEKLAEYTVRSTDIDLGGHMNNAAYVRMLMGCFTSKQIRKMNIRSMEVIFLNPCYEGETLEIRKGEQDGITDLAVLREGKPAVLARIR